MSILFERLKTEMGIAVDIAVKGDIDEILDLQKLAYKSEAEIYNDFTILPLTQTLEDLKARSKGINHFEGC